MAFSITRSIQFVSNRLLRVTQWTITNAEPNILPRNIQLVRSITTFDSRGNQQIQATKAHGMKTGCLAVMNSDRTDFGLSGTHKDVSKRTISVRSQKRFAQETQPDEKAQQTQQSEEKATEKPLTQRQKLARIFAAYGSTAVVFHTSISLTSLGTCYLVVSSGIDMVSLLEKIGIASKAGMQSTLASGASTFVIAYACHKVFMPVRIFLTVTCTPIIVRKLRSIGLLKEKKPAEGQKT